MPAGEGRRTSAIALVTAEGLTVVARGPRSAGVITASMGQGGTPRAQGDAATNRHVFREAGARRVTAPSDMLRVSNLSPLSELLGQVV